MTEQNRQILRDWATEVILPLLKDDGLYVVPDNSPLSSREVASALIEVAKHPSYRAQTVVVPDQDGRVVTLALEAGEPTIRGDGLVIRCGPS